MQNMTKILLIPQSHKAATWLIQPKCYPDHKQQMCILPSPPCSRPAPLCVCGLISYAGSSGSGQHGPHCRVAQQSPQGQALCSRSPGSNPLPCVPASAHMSSYGPPYVELQESRCRFSICEIQILEGFQHSDGRSWVTACKGDVAAKRQQAELQCVEC